MIKLNLKKVLDDAEDIAEDMQEIEGTAYPELIKFVVLWGALISSLYVFSSSFDETEIKTILTTLIITIAIPAMQRVVKKIF